MNWQAAQTTTLTQLIRQPRLGLVTDVDGTISPIVDRPEAAYVPAAIQELLRQLLPQLTLVAVISGRSAADVAGRVGVTGVQYIGNHGLERWVDDRTEVSPMVAAHRPALAQAIARLQPLLVPGMGIEDKGATISVHYRQAADPAAVAAWFTPRLQALAADLNLHFFTGRMIFELRPPLDMHKGTAFRDLVRAQRLDGAIYIGDDITDVDALAAARDLRQTGAAYTVGVGVVDDETPAAVAATADLTAAGVDDVAAFFAWLLKARSASLT